MAPMAPLVSAPVNHIRMRIVTLLAVKLYRTSKRINRLLSSDVQRTILERIQLMPDPVELKLCTFSGRFFFVTPTFLFDNMSGTSQRLQKLSFMPLASSQAIQRTYLDAQSHLLERRRTSDHRNSSPSTCSFVVAKMFSQEIYFLSDRFRVMCSIAILLTASVKLSFSSVLLN